MPLPDISIQISANTVAWYAAIVSTVGLLATLYTAWKDRPRVKITINPDMRIRNVPQYDPNKTYIDITVRNRGRRPIKIQNVLLKLYRTKGYMVINDSLLQHTVRVLKEDDPRTNFFVEQRFIDPATIEYVVLYDETGKMHIKYHRRGAFFRRLISRWIYNLDYPEPPTPHPPQPRSGAPE
jgi:hypothetical protein